MADEIVHEQGYVLMLDALGTRQLINSHESAEKFLGIIDEGIQKAIRENSETWEGVFEQDGAKFNAPRVMTFGDTVLVSWPTEEGAAAEIVRTFGIAEMTSIFVHASLTRGVPFRGALTFGDYSCTNTQALGPAINEVAEWHEVADCIGVVTTPRFSHRISMLYDSIVQHHQGECVPDIHNFYWNHQLPVKDGIVAPRWIVNWMSHVMSSDNDTLSETGFSKIDYYLNKMERPRAAESKFENTMRYYDDYRKFLSDSNGLCELGDVIEAAILADETLTGFSNSTD